MASSTLPTISTQLLHIQPIASDAPLSQAQQQFNQLLEQLTQARVLWQAWEDAAQAVQQRYAKQIRPQWAQLWQLRAQLVQWLDACSAQPMPKRELQTLKDVIVQMSEAGMEQVPDTEWHALFTELHQRYAALPRMQADTPAPAPDSLHSGSNGEDGAIDWEDAHAVAAYAQAQADAARAHAEHARAQHRQQRQNMRAQRKAQAQPKSPPVLRTVYRQLASHLHPDRELDATARAHKTQLMQRVNQAYEAADLLALLQLQWEIEQLSPKHLRQMQDAHLQRFTAVLAEQLKHLQQATRASEQTVAHMLGLPAERHYAPQKMPAMLRQYAQSLQQQTLQLQQLLAQWRQQPDMLEQWLQAQR